MCRSLMIARSDISSERGERERAHAVSPGTYSSRGGGLSRSTRTTGGTERFRPYRNPGRRSVPITDDEVRFVLLAHGRYRVGALYLKERIERDHGIHINHDRIQRV